MRGEAMDTKRKQELIELFNQTQYMPYHEALGLFKACQPERFNLIKRMLVDDIRQFKLKVYFWSTYSYNDEIPLLNPVAVTPDTLGFHVPPPSENYANFWLFGELATHELKDWLQSKGIANFSCQASTTTDQSPTAPQSEALQPVTETEATPKPLEEAGTPQSKNDTNESAICVPRALWEGKPSASIRNAMRPKEEGGEGFSDAVIAYVLFNWAKLENKTEIGRLLGKPEQDDSSYRRLTTRLLNEAASLTIMHD